MNANLDCGQYIDLRTKPYKLFLDLRRLDAPCATRTMDIHLTSEGPQQPELVACNACIVESAYCKITGCIYYTVLQALCIFPETLGKVAQPSEEASLDTHIGSSSASSFL
jgi:hypothetical protein